MPSSGEAGRADNAVAVDSPDAPADPGASHDAVGPKIPSSSGSTGWSATGVVAALVATILPTILSPSLNFPTFVPKYMVLLLLGGGGLVSILRLARSSAVSLAAIGATAFLAVGLLSVALSPAWNVGFFGLYAWGTGWLFWLGCVGAFAIGARLRAADLGLVLGGFVAGAALNAIAAIYQLVAVPGGALYPYQGDQASGLLGNPIHLEAIELAAIALVAHKAVIPKEGFRPALVPWWALLALLSVGLEFSLERFALAVLALLLVGSLVVYGWRALSFVVVLAASYGGAILSKGSGIAQRVTSGTSSETFGTRLHVWDLAVRSLAHHPVLGTGPGELVSVVAPHVSQSFQRHLGPGLLPVDSHNLLVEVLATTGLLGFACFAVWTVGALTRARGAFLAAAMSIFAVELVEPLNIGVTPIAFLALGAATATGGAAGLPAIRRWWVTRWTRRPARPELGRNADGASGANAVAAWGSAAETEPIRADPDGTESPAPGSSPQRRRAQVLTEVIATTVLLAAAAFLGCTMYLGDRDLQQSAVAVLAPTQMSYALDANRLLPYWAESASSVTDAYFTAGGGRGDLDNALAWSFKAAQRDPADPLLRVDIGNIYAALKERSQADVEYKMALELDPFTANAFIGLGVDATHRQEWSTALRWFEDARAVEAAPSQSLVRFINQARVHVPSPG